MHPIQTVQYIMHLEFRNMDVTFPKTLQVNRMGLKDQLKYIITWLGYSISIVIVYFSCTSNVLHVIMRPVAVPFLPIRSSLEFGSIHVQARDMEPAVTLTSPITSQPVHSVLVKDVRCVHKKTLLLSI